MGVNSLPKTVTGQRRGCDLNPGPSVPGSSTLTTRLPLCQKLTDNYLILIKSQRRLYVTRAGHLPSPQTHVPRKSQSRTYPPYLPQHKPRSSVHDSCFQGRGNDPTDMLRCCSPHPHCMHRITTATGRGRCRGTNIRSQVVSQHTRVRRLAFLRDSLTVGA